MQLLWEEYREANPDGYRYSRFCELYQRWRSKLDVVLRQEHKAGEKMFVDWAGATIPVRFDGRPIGSLPPGVSLTITSDDADYISGAIHEVLLTLIIATSIVIAIIYLFL